MKNIANIGIGETNIEKFKGNECFSRLACLKSPKCERPAQIDLIFVSIFLKLLLQDHVVKNMKSLKVEQKFPLIE